jgi:hypothetical protein
MSLTQARQRGVGAVPLWAQDGSYGVGYLFMLLARAAEGGVKAQMAMAIDRDAERLAFNVVYEDRAAQVILNVGNLWKRCFCLEG